MTAIKRSCHVSLARKRENRYAVYEHLFGYIGASVETVTIVGIDPGLANTGWGVVCCASSKAEPVAYGCISTDAGLDLPARLAIIHDNLCEVIDRYHPVALSAESIFFGSNSKSAIPTAQARGAALVACACKGLEYGEYSPTQIKMALVGTGTADKNQVQYMVKAILGLDHVPKPDHAADALAAAITHARLRTTTQLEQRVSQTPQPAAAAASKSKYGQRVAAALEKELAKEKRS